MPTSELAPLFHFGFLGFLLQALWDHQFPRIPLCIKLHFFPVLLLAKPTLTRFALSVLLS